MIFARIARFFACPLALSLGLGLGVVLHSSAKAQMVEVTDESSDGKSSEHGANGGGKDKARSYFRERKIGSGKDARGRDFDRAPTGATEDGGAPRLLALRVGTFFSSQAYKWGETSQNNVGQFSGGLDYRLGEWVNTADVMLRVDFTTYSLEEGNARKLSFAAVVAFPDANSRFPLYFGAAVGPGFFVQQIHAQSALALDYSLLAGARFLNVIDQVGFLVETGIKNHVHLFSQGQFNGVYINVGTVFAF